MVLATQVKINQESAEMILKEIVNKERKYFIMTVMVFDLGENSMRFNPPRTEITTFFDKLLVDMLLTAEEVNRVTTQPDF